MTKLSILIATVPERWSSFDRIAKELIRQKTNDVQISVDETPKSKLSIGAKRQRLLERAEGEYIVFVDDDDIVMPNYIDSILKALESGPDCVDMDILMLTNQKNPQMCYHHLRNRIWHQDKDEYYRTVTQFNPVKRELALKAGFKDMRFGEDKDYSDRLTKLCITSTYIPEIIYLYNYSNKIPHDEKYGIQTQ
jgi:glycosyltransferase involved in cell wall biosynthesis